MCAGAIYEDEYGAADEILLQYIAHDSGQAVKAISHINWLAAQIVLQVCTQSNHGLVNFQAHAVWKRKGHLW
jgi:hypothetical protein